MTLVWMGAEIVLGLALYFLLTRAAIISAINHVLDKAAPKVERIERRAGNRVPPGSMGNYHRAQPPERRTGEQQALWIEDQ